MTKHINPPGAAEPETSTAPFRAAQTRLCDPSRRQVLLSESTGCPGHSYPLKATQQGVHSYGLLETHSLIRFSWLLGLGGETKGKKQTNPSGPELVGAILTAATATSEGSETEAPPGATAAL